MLTMNKNQLNFGRKRLAVQFSLKSDKGGFEDTYVIRVVSNDEEMRSSEFIPLLRNPQFALKLSSVFMDIPHKAISFQIDLNSNYDSDRTVVITAKPAPNMKGLWPNSNLFSKWMNGWGSNGYIYSKDHPNGKGKIIFPAATERDFSHFMTFLKNSDDDEKSALWNEISKQISAIEPGDIIIGTNEIPIPWLNIHVIK